MRFAPTAKFLALAYGASKFVQTKIYVRKSATVSDALSAGTWIDVTHLVDRESAKEIGSRIEHGVGQFTSDPIDLKLSSLAWWKLQIEPWTAFLEIKVDMALGGSETDISAADGGTVFSGLVDPRSLNPSEEEDTISFTAYTYDDYGRRVGADRITQQIIDPAYGTAGGLILNNIQGMYVTDANVSGYALKRGVHVLYYDYNGGTRRAKIDDGAWANLPGGDGSTTLVNLAGDQKLTVYTLNTKLATSGTSQQDIVVTVETNTIPQTWVSRMSVFTMMRKLFNASGVPSLRFDDIQMRTFDGRNITSMVDVPPGDSFAGKPRTVMYDRTQNGLWIGVGTNLYFRSFATGLYTRYGDLSSYGTVMRFLEDPTLNRLLIITRDSSNYYWIVGFNTSSKAVNFGYKLTARGTGDMTALGCMNFAYAANYGAAGVVFYQSNASSIYYFDIDALSEVDTGLFSPTVNQYTNAGWSDGTSYFCQLSAGVGLLVKLYMVQDSAGWFMMAMAGGVNLDPMEEAVFKADENKTYYNTIGGNGLYTYNHSSDAIATVSTDAHGNLALVWCTETEGMTMISSMKTMTGPYRQWPCLTKSGSVWQWFNEVVYPSFDQVAPPGRLTYDWIGKRWFGILDYSFLMFQYGNRASMYVYDDMDLQGLRVMDVVREICNAYQLAFVVGAAKVGLVYRRNDDAGNPVASGSVLTVTKDMVESIQIARRARESYNIIEVANDTQKVWYDGERFGIGDSYAVPPDAVLSVSSKFIATQLLQDLAFFLRKGFSIPMDEVRIELANVPIWQWEPFDGIILDVQTDVLTYRGRGVIVETKIKQDGGMAIVALVPSCAQMDHARYDNNEVYA